MTDPSTSTSTSAPPSATPSAHPLDPLSEQEFRQAAAILRRDREIGQRWRFASIELVEPDKEVIRSWRRGDAITRHAQIVCWNRDDGKAYKAVVSLTEDSLLAFDHLPGKQPNFTVDEWHEVDEALRTDQRVIDALAKRGITDVDRVLMDVWAFGDFLIPEKYKHLRVGWTDTWYRVSERSNPYCNPVNGLHCLVDLNAMELLEIEDTHDPGAKPPIMGEYLPELVPGQQLREDLKPLEVNQRDGSSFTLDGYELTWQRWSMRLGFNYREGPVIHTVAYEDGGRKRTIAHRMSFAEMVVPYRDPTADHARRTAYDIGEWGLGVMTTSLELGCDCLGEITYVDVALTDSKGEPYPIKQALCIHEEDDRVLWKHVDAVAGAEVRRSRRLVVSAHATVANYEYLLYWNFYEDGNIECEVRATGLMVVGHFPEGEQPPPYGTVVDQRTYAPFHQHFLVARLDMEVDGPDNTVVMTESQPAPLSADNPHGLGLLLHETPLRTEAEGRQDYKWETQRGWKVVNPGRTNAMGAPVAYKLVPGACFPAMIDPSSPILRRAEVIAHQLWVTPFHREERWPCGEFPVQSQADEGLPVWTAANRSIENADVVLWYVFGLHHITRPEEWPIMPVDKVSFWLKPFGFFDRNPALDVAPSPHGQDQCHTGSPAEPHGHLAVPDHMAPITTDEVHSGGDLD